MKPRVNGNSHIEKERINRSTHSKVESELHVPLVDIVVETRFLVGLEAVGQGRGSHRRNKGGQEADNQGCEAHCEQGCGTRGAATSSLGLRFRGER